MAQRLIEVEKLPGYRRGANQENQDQKSICEVSVFLGMRRCKNLGS